MKMKTEKWIKEYLKELNDYIRQQRAIRPITPFEMCVYEDFTCSVSDTALYAFDTACLLLHQVERIKEKTL